MEHIPEVDWALAARTGRTLVHPGPELTRPEIAAVVAELRQAAAMATDHVAEVTQLERPAPAEVLVVDRASWLAAVAQSAEAMLAGVGAVTGEPLSLPARVGAKALGVQAGGVFALIANRILGQFDPFVTPSRLLLVAPNIVAVERRLGATPSDFRLWVCLHEETHRFQFGHAPWLKSHLLGLLGELVDGDELRFGWPEHGDGVRSLIGSPEQKQAFEQVSALMSLMEGHADVMMDRVGASVVPTYESIRKSFEARRDEQGWAAWLRKLLGLDMKRAQYRDGAKFCREVIEAADVATLNRAFEAPGLLPSMDEIHDPQRWLHRL